jgi:hypothetical protein
MELCHLVEVARKQTVTDSDSSRSLPVVSYYLIPSDSGPCHIPAADVSATARLKKTAHFICLVLQLPMRYLATHLGKTCHPPREPLKVLKYRITTTPCDPSSSWLFAYHGPSCYSIVTDCTRCHDGAP